MAPSLAPLVEGNLAAALVAGAAPGDYYVSHRGTDRISELAGRGTAIAAVRDRSSAASWPRAACYSGG